MKIQKINIKYFILPTLCFVFIFCGIFDAGAQTFQNPVSETTVDGVLNSVLDAVLSVIAVLAILMIVIGGILYITSGGDQGRIQLAKTTITAAIIGLAVAVAAPTFLKEIYTALGSTPTGQAAGARTLSQILTSVLNTLLGFIGTLSILMLVVGGIMYMTASGDQGRADTAKRTIQYAIVGLVVAILSLVIVRVVVEVL